jgi:hypothetical protein
LAVSATLSPFAADEDCMSEQLITVPPSRCIEDSKDNRVRVLGS